MGKPNRNVGVLLLVWAGSLLLNETNALAQIEPPVNPFSLILVASDLEDASETMRLHDIDDSGDLNESERRRISGEQDPMRFDLDQNGRLTHLELAIRFASIRDEFDIQEIDRTVVRRAMSKRDSNKNSQIDPDEISRDWPEDPDEIDENSDGTLSETELVRAFAFRRVIREQIGILGVDQGWAIKIRNRFDANGDGGLNPDEWDDTPLPGDPAKGDEDSDQRLSLLEIATILARHRQKLGLAPSDQLTIRPIVMALDRDFNGELTPEELVPLKGDPKKFNELLEFDANQDQTVSLEEIETELGRRRDEKGYGDRDAAEAQTLLRRQDSNRDRKLTKDELRDNPEVGFLSKIDFPQVDRNRDEVIDLDELARYLSRNRP